MKTSFFKDSLLVLLSVALSIATTSAQTTVQLTGGDSSDGLSLTGTLVGAVYAEGDSTSAITLQGYAFQPYGSPYGSSNVVDQIAITAPGGLFTPAAADTATNADFTTPGNSTNDTALLTLANSGLLYGGSGTDTVVISGLTNGQSYNVDFLMSLDGYGTRGQEVSINGGTPVVQGTSTDTPYFGNANGIYDTMVTAMAENNKITAVFTGTTGAGPVINGVIVLDAPEPSTWFLLLGGFGVLLLSQRLRKLSE